MVDIYPYTKKPIAHSRNTNGSVEKYLSDFWERPAVLQSSARVGIYQALKFFGLTRQDQVLVPDFLCQAVLNIINVSGFPVKVPDAKTKAVLVFHQWGYPQKMAEVMAEAKKRNLIVIEDCAHSFDSTYQGKNIGTFGDLAVFSFAKCFTTYNGGALISANQKLVDYIRGEQATRRGWKDNLFQRFAFLVAKKSFTKGQWRFWLDGIYLKSIFFPNLGRSALKLLPPNEDSLRQELVKRKNNYRFLKNTIKADYLLAEQDPNIDVNPLCMPIFLPVDRMAAAQKALVEIGIQAEILHFDLNRNVFQPNYQKCFVVPCHQQMNEGQLSQIAQLINQI